MPLVILALLIGLPILELTIMVDVASEIGALNAVLLTIGTAILGLYIARLQGFAVMRKMQSTMNQGGTPVEGLVHGFFLFLAGIMLFLPGFITDSIGVLLLIPPIRTALGRFGMARMMVRPEPPRTWRDGQGHTIIEGQIVHHDDEQDPPTKH